MFTFGPALRSRNTVDPNFADVVLLLNGQGIDGGTTITDESTYNRAPSSSVGITTSTTLPLFGTSSLQATTGSRLRYARASELDFGTALWTLEGKFYATTVDATRRSIIAYLFDGGNDTAWDLDFITTEIRARVGAGGTSTVAITGSGPTANTWTDFALCRDTGGVIRLYVNGSQVGSATLSGGGSAVLTVPTVATDATPCLFNGSNQTENFLGRMYARWTRNVCRYPSGTAYTPPTGPYPVG